MVSKPYINTIFWNKLYYVQVQQIILKFTFSDNIAKRATVAAMNLPSPLQWLTSGLFWIKQLTPSILA